MSILLDNSVRPTRRQEGWKYIELTGVLEKPYEPFPEDYAVFSDAAVIGGPLPIAPEFLSRFSNPFLDANSAKHQKSLLLDILENTCAREPLHIAFRSGKGAGARGVIHPRVEIQVRPGIHARVILDLGAPEHMAAFSNASCLIRLEKNSRLQLAVRGRARLNAITFLNVFLRQERDSIFEGAVYESGSFLERIEIKTDLAGENASFDMRGLQLLSGSDQAFSHLEVSHNAPHTRSNQVYRSVLMDHSVSEYNSLVHATRAATHTQSDQMNKNLILSDDARAYSRPQLKIDTDDVRCNHGATAGQINPEEVNYLRSRGLKPSQAKSLIIHGFADEFLQALPQSEVKEYIAADIENRLRGTRY